MCYARTVVHQEWPRMEDGVAGEALNPWGVALFKTLKLADPRTTPRRRRSRSGSTRPLIAKRLGVTASTVRRT